MGVSKRNFKVTKSSKVLVTDLIPGDIIRDDEQHSGTIEGVNGITKNGLLHWSILLTTKKVNKYIFKLVKA